MPSDKEVTSYLFSKVIVSVCVDRYRFRDPLWIPYQHFGIRAFPQAPWRKDLPGRLF